MNNLDFMIEKRKAELILELKKLKELKKNERKLKAIEQQVYQITPMAIFISWVGSFTDWITILVKQNKSEEK